MKHVDVALKSLDLVAVCEQKHCIIVLALFFALS